MAKQINLLLLIRKLQGEMYNYIDGLFQSEECEQQPDQKSAPCTHGYQGEDREHHQTHPDGLAGMGSSKQDSFVGDRAHDRPHASRAEQPRCAVVPANYGHRGTNAKEVG